MGRGHLGHQASESLRIIDGAHIRFDGVHDASGVSLQARALSQLIITQAFERREEAHEIRVGLE